MDDELGLQPHQRTSGEFQSLGCAFAVFVPFATAATLLSWASGVAVSPRAVWEWVQAAGQRAMEQLHAQLQAAAEGHLPPEEPLAAEVAAMPWALGADGVMVPFRPEGGHPRGKTAWHEVKVGVLARLGRHRTRTGEMVARLHQRRLVAVFRDIEALQGRLWLEALRQGIRSAPQVVWLSDGARGLWCLFEECFTAYAMGIGLLPRGAAAVEGSNRLAGWTHEPCASVVQLGTAPPTAWPAGWGLGRLGRCPGRGGVASDSTRHVAHRVCLPATASRAYRLCQVQRAGAAAGQRDGRECLQMAHPATLQRGRDAVE